MLKLFETSTREPHARGENVTQTGRTTPAVGIGDRVHVVGRHIWRGEQLHGRTGVVTGVTGVDTRRSVYNICIDGAGFTAPLTAPEIEIIMGGSGR